VAEFEALFRAHYEGLVRFATRLVGSQMEPEELVQDVMLKVWERRASLAMGDELKAYLYRATRNHALNLIRRRRLERLWRSMLPSEEPAVEAEGDREAGVSAEAEREVRAAIDALPDRCREIFLLSREQGLTYSAIAQTLGISVKTVETQMGRALKSLRFTLRGVLDR
jgi:RNA polymerase sigma-70 factor (ECF subfamily)